FFFDYSERVQFYYLPISRGSTKNLSFAALRRLFILKLYTMAMKITMFCQVSFLRIDYFCIRKSTYGKI
ncbi:MAG: hypothetical protein RBR84_13130, partial [Bacteroidales bacterium]|nr:hypothetical protein [Bacteroidales bacterium]